MLITLKNRSAIEKLTLGQKVWTVDEHGKLQSYLIVSLQNLFQGGMAYVVIGQNAFAGKSSNFAMLAEFYISRDEAVNEIIARIEKELKQAEAELKPLQDRVNELKREINTFQELNKPPAPSSEKK